MLKETLLIFMLTVGVSISEPILQIDGDRVLEPISETKYELIETITDRYSQKNYVQGDDGLFFIRKIPFLNGPEYITAFYIPGNEGSISYYDKYNVLKKEVLKNGLLPKDSFIIVDTDKHHTVLGQPYIYRSLGYGTIDAKGQGDIRLHKEEGKWLVTYSLSLTEDTFGIIWGVNSPNLLVDFNKPNMAFIWSGYDLDINDRLSYDGYHFKSSSTYTPYTTTSYWRMPSNHLANSMIKTGGALASDIMGNGLLQIESENISENGSLLSLPRSNWLMREYNIEAGFFDTRFNADTAETYLVAYQKTSNELYKEKYNQLAEYYLNHMNANHFKVSRDGVEGLLVMDYYKDAKTKPNHSSLNHQAQAIHLFLKLYAQEKDQRYLDAAMKMLNGIKATRDKWVMSNGNLEYAYMPNGSMGLVDYPYLTYNDLYTVQKDLLWLNGNEDADIAYLMASKRKWMDSNNVKGYRK